MQHHRSQKRRDVKKQKDEDRSINMTRGSLVAFGSKCVGLGMKCEQKVKAMYIDQESIHIITWAGKTTRKGF